MTDAELPKEPILESEDETHGKKADPKEIAKKTRDAVCKFGKAFIGKMHSIWHKIKSIPKRIRDYFTGTEEHPLYPFCRRARFIRWYKVKFRNYVYLYTTIYDRTTDEYIQDKEIIKSADLPKDAVHVTGMKHCWHLDLDLPRRGFSSVSDNGFTAVDAFLYMKCNKINDAMRINLDKHTDFDTKKLITLICLGVGGIVAVYYIMGGMSF